MRRKEDSERERERDVWWVLISLFRGRREVWWEWEGGVFPGFFGVVGVSFATLSLSSSGGEYKFLSLTRP